MTQEKTRSPFGELVRTLRKERRWTQARLAREATPRQTQAETRMGITERSIRAIERRAPSPKGWTRPRQETVAALASAFGLAEGSVTRQAFLQAAAITRQTIDRAGVVDPGGRGGQRFVLAGREPHLDQITTAIDVATTGAAQAIFVTAEAGTGKTWLIVEACRQAIADHPHLVVLWGNCQRRGGMTDPFQAFRQILRLMVGDTRSTSPAQLIGAENRARIEQRLPTALSALDDSGRDLLHRLLPVDALTNAMTRAVADRRMVELIERLSAQPIPHQAIDPAESMRRLLRAYASEGPVVLVLEDLHSADGPTLDLLASLLEEIPGSNLPIAFLASFRPVSTWAESDTTQALRGLLNLAPAARSTIDLSTALSVDASKQFISALAADMGVEPGDHGVSHIQQQTLGLPIFVKGVLRQLREAGTEDQSSTAEGSRSRWAVFDAEFDLLSPAARRALLAASVQGTLVSLKVLADVLDTSAEQLAVILNETSFRRMGLLQPVPTPASEDPQDTEFQFSHVMLRDRLHDTRLSDIERAHWHWRTAEALKRQTDATLREHQAQIAYHLEQAGRPVAAAQEWLKVAADLMTHHEFEHAVMVLTRAREQDLRRLAPALETEALLALGACARSLDRRDDAARWLELGLDLARRRRLAALEAQILSLLGMLAYDAGEVDRGADLLRSAVSINEAAGDHATAAQSLARLSHNLQGLGLYEAAIREAERSLGLATQVGDEHLVNAASIALANCWLDLGQFETAHALYSSTLERCERLGDVHRANICLINISLCRIGQGAWNDAAEALAPFQTQGRPVVPRFVAVIEFQAGLIAEGEGDWIRAHRHYQASADIRQGNGQSALLIDSLAGLLRVAIAGHDLKEVERLVATIDLRVAQHGLDGIEHAALMCLSMMDGGKLLGNQGLTMHYAEIGLAFLDARAAAISSPASRQTYLEVVPAHRTLRMKAALVRRRTQRDQAASVACG